MNNHISQNNQLNISLYSLSSEIREQIIIEKVNNIHPYKITPPSEKDNRYSTYVKENKKRRYIKKTYEKDLYQALFDFYYGLSTSKPTIEEYFKEWLSFKSQFNSPRTLERYMQIWKKHYSNSSFVKLQITKVDFKTIESFYINLCNSTTITKKEFSNIFTIIKGIMELAIRNDIINTNPCDKVDKRLFKLQQNKVKTSDTEILYKDELTKLLETLDAELITNPSNQKALAIKLMLLSGVRCGELCALKFSDIEKCTHGTLLNISRADVINPTVDIETLSVSNYKHSVLNQTKTQASNRRIALPSHALDIINKLKDIHTKLNITDNDFILFDENGRITTNKIAKYLATICKKAGIKNYSPHKLRKTYSSILLENKIQIKDIQSQLGHTNLETTMKYLFPLLISSQLCEPITNIFSNL